MSPIPTPDPQTEWRQGWYRAAAPRPSPHFGARPPNAQVDLLVVHSISLPPGKYGGSAVESLFLGTLDCSQHSYYAQLRGMRVSAHFFIRRTGELLQFVSCDDRAWHAGTSWYRERADCNDDSIGVELEGLEGFTFEPEQYTTLATLGRALAERYPIAHIAGHEHIAPGRKADPGSGFDWALLRRLLPNDILRFPGA